MSYEDVKKVWMNGRLVDFADAKIHAFSHVFHYGSAMFEGARRLQDAARLGGLPARRAHQAPLRLLQGLPDGGSRTRPPEFREAIVETIRANGFDECYIRPVIYRGLGALGVNPFNSPVDVMIAVWRWGKYLGDEALESGVDVCVSSWNRMAPNTFPAMAKATGNYLNSALIKMEAVTNGFTEGIALDNAGRVSEGSGENIFVVYGGRLLTPPLAGTILPGITRDSIMTHRPGRRLHGRRAADRPRDALHRRRGVLHRHGRGDHPDPLGRPHRRRRRAAGPGHRADPEGVLRADPGRRARTATAG